MKTDDHRRHHEDQGDGKARPERPDEYDQRLADGERQAGGEAADEDCTGPARAGAIGPDAGVKSDEERQGEDGKVEQQPAHGCDGGNRCKDSENEHGGVSRLTWNGRAFHHHHGAT